MMYDAIKTFNKQFEYQPTIENAGKLVRKNRIIVAGMGGSELAAMLMKLNYPEIDFILHRNYGLPRMGDEKLKDSLVLAVSYSGNTEETIDAFNAALQKGIPVAVIATGGKLLELAQQNSLPYVQMPSTGIQPRMALGLSTMALLKMAGQEKTIEELRKLASSLNPTDFEEEGKKLAQALKDRVPLIYVSKRNEAVGYVWKIKLNETGKIPAFYNVFPELNHNEMTSFDVQESTRHLSKNFSCILIRDSEDHPRIQRRMETLEQLYATRGIPVHRVDLEGTSRLFRIFASLILADWTSFYTADLYHVEAEQVPMVEEFKRLI